MRSTVNTQVYKKEVFSIRILSVFATLFFVLFAVLSFVKLAQANVGVVPAPTLISIAEASKFTRSKPVITGLTVNGTQVDIFIDNQFNGSATVRNHESGTANFYYYPAFPLKPGPHTLYAVAKKEANIGQGTSKINFEIMGFVPPTLLIPVFNLETIESKPFIVGLVKNNSKVKIYLDNQLDGEILAKNHPSGTANFAYKPKSNLALGTHHVKAVAVNVLTGQESRVSSLVTFNIELSYPAPTLFRPTVKYATWFQPNISGVAKNGSHVEVYVNNVKHRVDLEDHPSGTTSFTYRPEENLRPGQNVIFAVAYSKTGKMSRKSNVIYWDLTPPQEAAQKPLGLEKPTETEISDVTRPKELEIEVEPKDRSGEAEVIIKDEAEAPAEVSQPEEPVVSGEAEKTQSSEPEAAAKGELAEEGTNWSKIFGLIILAVLIIILIIQLLKKEEPEEKKGETLKLFEAAKKEKGKPEEKRKESNPEENQLDVSDIPPPPPPSSNLPF